jgi:hypothetical protein
LDFFFESAGVPELVLVPGIDSATGVGGGEAAAAATVLVAVEDVALSSIDPSPSASSFD